MKIKTNILQDVVSKSIKGASMNKLIPLTSLIGIKVEGQILSLTTTDGNNQLIINQKLEDNLISSDFYTVVNAELFAKLVGKTTKEYIELENEDSFLVVKGNGTYRLDIPINEDGDIIRFPAYNKLEDTECLQISTATLKTIIQTAKSSVAQTLELPMLTGYYLGDKSISTDRQMVCYIDNKLFNSPTLISSEMAELISLLGEPNVDVYMKDNEIIFKTNSITIYGKQLDGVNDYPINQLEQLIAIEYNSFVKVDKTELLDVLDRMSLFITDYDKNGVLLQFNKEGLVITSQKSNATEILEIKNTIENEFDCMVDIEMFKAQLQSLSTDIAEIHYGQPTSIQLREGNTILVLSLLDMEG